MNTFNTKSIFTVAENTLEQTALDVFRFQFEHQSIYRTFCEGLKRHPNNVSTLADIPFLPISFFKTHEIITNGASAEVVFESSGTTGAATSKHLVADSTVYEESFMRTFRRFYGAPENYCILALLPSYLERQNSSLVFMAERLMRASNHPENGFFMSDFENLAARLAALEFKQQKVLLLGVTYALLDFAALYPMQLNHTIVMETGGMKGRKSEMLRTEVHEVLKQAFALQSIHSEYGMTELLSQAYSYGNGIFECTPWMKVLVRDVYNPLSVTALPRTGALNVIDLANVYACSFIATEDLGTILPNNCFEVAGRIDNSDIRGCSLMYAN